MFKYLLSGCFDIRNFNLKNWAESGNENKKGLLEHFPDIVNFQKSLWLFTKVIAPSDAQNQSLLCSLGHGLAKI